VTGNFGDSRFRRPFFWTEANGGKILPVPPEADKVESTAINSADQIVGRYTSAKGTSAFIWSEEEGMQRLQPLPGCVSSAALAINSAGEVVGFCLCGQEERAVMWTRDRRTMDLNDAIPATSGIFLTSALAINDRGQIAVTAVPSHALEQDQGHQHAGPGVAYLLTPKQE
jgi:uncharacterized membrane protein